MKKSCLYILGILFVASINIFSKCTKEEDCINCVVENAIAHKVVVDTVKGTYVTIYPVMTPSNHSMCDSMVYNPQMGAYVPPYMLHKDYQKECTAEEARDSLLAGNDTACPCRINPDTAYNDKLNTYFHIGGIEKFPYNRLIIKTTDDTTKLRVYTDYDNKNNLFIGEVAMDTTLGYYEYNNTKPLASGVYSYMLVMYKEEQHYTQIGDTITGNFVIVRSPRAKNVKCRAEAFDKDDPLLGN